MRKLVAEFRPKAEIAKYWGTMMDCVESISIVEMLRLDFEKGTKMGVCEYVMREGHTIEDLDVPELVDVLTVLRDMGGGRYICLVKVHVPREFRATMREFDLDLIWDSPMHISGERAVISVVGTEADLKRFLELMRPLGEELSVTITEPAYGQNDLLSVLTDRQREMLVAAKRYGYYDTPRRMTSEEVSKRVGVSKATFLEHLRKAEGRLMDTILAGL